MPRLGVDGQGRSLRHLSWITWGERGPIHLAHRWYGDGGELHYEETLWSAPEPAAQPAAPEPAATASASARQLQPPRC
ncbi:MAG: hypothetical protein ACKOZW_09620 [Cyanobium sp.]